MTIKPTRNKVIICIILTIIWYIYLFSLYRSFECPSCNAGAQCKDYSYLSALPKGCGCCTRAVIAVITDVMVLFPGIVVYLLISFLQYMRHRQELGIQARK